MSRTIDERIVQMTFNNQDFERNAKQTINTLGKLNDTTNNLEVGRNLSKSLDAVNQSARKIDLSSITEGFNNIVKGATALEVVVTGALLNIGKKITDIGFDFVNDTLLGQIKTGWAKYAEAISSEQTIMSAVAGKINELTGEAYNIDSITERISKLQWYTDETSYNISQMTSAIGSFTSAGIDLDIATNAIIGISNACADAGVSTEKADSAFIGFSKAIGAGAMSLSVWNNQLKTSGLINSERFKQSLIDSAVAIGTLKEVSEGLYKTTSKSAKSGIEVTLANMTESFTNTKWANSDVMLHALSSYSDTIDELYDRINKGEFDTASEAIAALTDEYIRAGKEVPKSLAAFTRAQEAISFGQAIQSVKDAVSSKWSQTFELIFGNYEEAKTLWTTLANEMWEWFASGGDKRNELLKEWHDGLSEFQQLFDGLDDDTNWTVQLVKKYSDAIDELVLSTPANKLRSDPSKLNQLEEEKKVFEDFFAAIDKNNGEKVVSIWKENSDLLIDNLQELPDKLVELQKEFDNLSSKDLLTNQIKQLEDEIGSGKLKGAVKKEKEALLETYKGLSGAISEGDRSVLQHYWKDNFKSLSKVYKQSDDYKDIIAEINKISKDTTLKEYEKEKLLNRQYMKLADISLEYSNIDEMTKIEADLNKELLGFFVDKKSGYDIFVDSLQRILENITNILDTIKTSFSNIFTSLTPKGLIDLTQGFSDLVDKVTLSDESLEKLGAIFEKIFRIIKNFLSVLSPIWTVLSTIWESFIKPLATRIVPVLQGILDIILNVSDAFSLVSSSVDKTVKSPLQSFFANVLDTLEPLIKIVQRIVDYIKDLTASWTDMNEEVSESSSSGGFKLISSILGILRKIFEGLEKVFNGSVPIVEKIKDILSNLFKYTGNVLKEAFTNINEVLSNTDLSAISFGLLFEKVFKTMFSGKTGDAEKSIVEWLDDRWKEIKSGIEGFTKNISKIPKMLDPLKNVLDESLKTLKSVWTEEMTASIKNLALGILAVSAALLLIASIPEEDLGRSLNAIVTIGIVMGGLLKLLDTLSKNQLSKKVEDVQKKGFTGLLSKFLSGLGGAFGAFGNILNADDPVIKINDTTQNIIAICAGLIAMAGALKWVSTIPSEQLWTALSALVVMMAAVYFFMRASAKLVKDNKKEATGSFLDDAGSDLTKTASAMSKISFGLLLVAAAIKVLGSMTATQLIFGVGALAAMLIAIGLFIKSVSKINIGIGNEDALKTVGKAVESVGVGLILVAAALKVVSTIGDPSLMVQSLAALSFILLAIYLFMQGMAKVDKSLAEGSSLIKIASSLVILGIAIGAVVGAIAVMAMIPVNSLAKGVTFLAIAFAEIFAFSKAMAGVGKGSGDLLAISASLVLFSAAIGVMALALAAIGAISTDNLTQAVLSIAVLMTLIGSISYIFSSGTVLKGILAFSAAFLAIGASVMMVGIGISQLVPLLMLLSTQSADIAAGISETLVAVFQTMLSVVPSFIIALVNAILQFVGLLIQGIADNLPVLLDGFLNLLITLCNALGEIAKQRGGELGVALGNLASGLIIGLWEALKGALGSLASGLISWITGGSDLDKVGEEISKKMGMSGDNDLLGGFVESIETQAPELSSVIDSAMSPVGSAGGDALSDSMIETMETRSPEVQKAAENLASDAAEEMDASSEASAASKSTVNGYVSFLQSGTASGLVSSAFSGLGYVGINALKQALGIKSPSRVMAEQGMYSVLGLVEGVYDNLNYVDEAGVDTANTLLNAMQLAAENANSILEDDLNPVITPVLDMSNIEGEAGQISSLLGNNSSYNAALSVSQANSLRGIQNGLQNPFAININFTINEAGGDLTEADFIKFGNEIANIVNEKLGGLV